MRRPEVTLSSGRAREYETDEIVVEWRPALCYHSMNCVNGLPRVFDKDARPWINVHGASADDIAAAVDRCPSGALRARRASVASVVAPMEITEVSPVPNGPLLVKGRVRIVDAEGNLVTEVERAALCRCGGSKNKPFCDGTHTTNGFTA